MSPHPQDQIDEEEDEGEQSDPQEDVEPNEQAEQQEDDAHDNEIEEMLEQIDSALSAQDSAADKDLPGRRTRMKTGRKFVIRFKLPIKKWK